MIATKKVAKYSVTPNVAIASWTMLAAIVASKATTKASEDHGLSLRRKSVLLRTGALQIFLKI